MASLLECRAFTYGYIFEKRSDGVAQALPKELHDESTLEVVMDTGGWSVRQRAQGPLLIIHLHMTVGIDEFFVREQNCWLPCSPSE